MVEPDYAKCKEKYNKVMKLYQTKQYDPTIMAFKLVKCYIVCMQLRNKLEDVSSIQSFDNKLQNIRIVLKQIYRINNENTQNPIHNNNYTIQQCSKCHETSLRYCNTCYNDIQKYQQDICINNFNLKVIELINEKLATAIEDIIKRNKPKAYVDNLKYYDSKLSQLFDHTNDTIKEMEKQCNELQLCIDNEKHITNEKIINMKNLVCAHILKLEKNKKMEHNENTEAMKLYIAAVKPQIKNILRFFQLKHDKHKHRIKIINMYLPDDIDITNSNTLRQMCITTVLGNIVKLLLILSKVLSIHIICKLTYNSSESTINNHYVNDSIGMLLLRTVIIDFNYSIYYKFNRLCGSDKFERYRKELSKYEKGLSISNSLRFLRYNLLLLVT